MGLGKKWVNEKEKQTKKISQVPAQDKTGSAFLAA